MCGFDGSDGVTGTRSGSATSSDGFPEGAGREGSDSKVFAFCDTGVVAEGLVTRAVLPKDSVDWFPPRRRAGGILNYVRFSLWIYSRLKSVYTVICRQQIAWKYQQYPWSGVHEVESDGGDGDVMIGFTVLLRRQQQR